MLLPQCESEENLLMKLAQVCQVFVDALPDLPEHRRLSLFTQLASTIDASKNLWILIALIGKLQIVSCRCWCSLPVFFRINVTAHKDDHFTTLQKLTYCSDCLL